MLGGALLKRGNETRGWAHLRKDRTSGPGDARGARSFYGGRRGRGHRTLPNARARGRDNARGYNIP